jgi:hypothetical protein
MVRFGQYLRHHEVPEWADQYVNYVRLSKLLVRVHAARKTARGGGSSAAGPSAIAAASPAPAAPSVPSSSVGGGGVSVLRRRGSVVSTDALLDSIGQGVASPAAATSASGGTAQISSSHAIALPSVADFLSHIPAAALSSSDERAFFEQLHAECRRVDAFFVRELDFFAARGAQLRDQTAGLREEASWIAEHDSSNDTSTNSTSSSSLDNHEGNRSTTSKASTRIAATAKSHAQHTERLRAAVKDQYHGLSLLLNFRVLNHTALSKLLARHARASASQWSGAAAALMPVIERSNFYRSQRLSELVYDCEVCDVKQTAGPLLPRQIFQFRVPLSAA